MKRFADHPTIKTEITDVNDDIRLLIEERVKYIQCWDDMSEEDRERVVEKLLDKGAGMFQLVKLQIPYLMDCGLKQDVFAQLEKMPKDLTKAYEEIYHKLSQNVHQKKLVDRAFMWVMCACEPLTTDFILAAIRRDGEKEELEEEITKNTLLGLCKNLLVCDAHQYSDADQDSDAHQYSDANQDSDIWVFSHASVVEFIEQKLWDFKKAHCNAAKVCLDFLMRAYGESMSKDAPATHNNVNEITSTRSGYQEIIRRNHDFHRYCRHHWVRHVQYQEFNPPNDGAKFDYQLRSLLQSFLGSPTQGGPVYQGWYRDILNDQIDNILLHSIFVYEVSEKDLSPPILPVLAMSRLSFDGILSDWWDSYEISSSHVNDRHEGPLILAAKAGCLLICERLIRKGASVNQCSSESTALSAAALHGQDKTVQLLLNHGASVDLLLQEHYGSALAAAAAAGQAFTVWYLIDQCNANVNLTLITGRYGTALNAACYWGQIDCVEILLEAGAVVDISSTPQSFSNAFLASEAFVGSKDSYSFPKPDCWRDRTERELADNKQEVTRILNESVASKAIDSRE
ncbi:Major facilitator superfamily domain general substrate transporter [Penicillium malachiteum]|nr:Major facilitator superfamily domain general substrate transporter [Penicillium malachiteum]